VSVVDRLVDGRRLRLGVQRPQQLILEPWYRSRAALCLRALFRSVRGASARLSRVRLRRESLPITALRLTPMSQAISRQVSPGFKAVLQEFDAFLQSRSVHWRACHWFPSYE